MVDLCSVYIRGILSTSRSTWHNIITLVSFLFYHTLMIHLLNVIVRN